MTYEEANRTWLRVEKRVLLKRLREEMRSAQPPPSWPLVFQIPDHRVAIAGHGHTHEEAIAEARDAIATLYEVDEGQVCLL